MRTARVDASDPDSLRHFYEEVGPIDDLVVTATRRGGAALAEQLAEQDMVDAFVGKPVAHLQAVSLALPTLDEHGSVTLGAPPDPAAIAEVMLRHGLTPAPSA